MELEFKLMNGVSDARVSMASARADVDITSKEKKKERTFIGIAGRVARLSAMNK